MSTVRESENISNDNNTMNDTGNKPFTGLVSVIIPVFNAKDSIESCVESLIKQSYTNVQIILVDDGSTDGSADICDDIARDVNNADGTDRASDEGSFNDEAVQGFSVKVIHTPNGGVSAARNNGLMAAEGDWVSFVDADDLVKEDYIERLVEAVNAFKAPAKSNDPAITSHKSYPLMMVTMTDRIMADTDMCGYYYIEHGVLNEDSHVWGKLFNKKEVDECLGNEWFPVGLSIGEDMLMLLEMASRQENRRVFKAISAGSYIYTENEQGAMLKPYKPSYLDQITCWDKAEGVLESCKGHISDYVYVRLAQIQIMAALLVTGKIAVSTKDEDYNDAINIIKRAIKHALKRNGAFASLSAGYKVKTIIFRLSPKLYLNMYGKWKA
ncbi:MAG: glycosyltransferase [Butyrivibrio sp.]|uniref:glycosyltransferase family 2 protein n=1 Tax=Butyrivibrio sp. TaxID=28121 RepID=UPI0025D67E1B|nr:glycosyltransferase [Butyrivibrio sp.]MCR5770134.1 glycosyltransferase [Butyrivibrio sp.]